MTAYAFWNNKGGVGKSFLCFVAASEYAHQNSGTDVYVLDLCPQGNVSEILLGGPSDQTQSPLQTLLGKTPRATIAGYLEARLNSPFQMIEDVTSFLVQPVEYNKNIPENLSLVCGDNLLEILAEAIRQTSQLAIPTNAWQLVLCWVKDLSHALRRLSGDRDTLFVLDCNPSFAIYTQLALAAADYVVVPFTADDSSRRGIENVVALLYGVSKDTKTESYAKLSFSKRAREEGIDVPKLHTFVSNRVTFYEGRPSKAFEAASKSIRTTMDGIHRAHRDIYAFPKRRPSEGFINVPDYHSACVIASLTGTPLHHLTPGPKELVGERIQINKGPLDRYREALEEFVTRL